jgi:hypothetical protein
MPRIGIPFKTLVNLSLALSIAVSTAVAKERDELFTRESMNRLATDLGYSVRNFAPSVEAYPARHAEPKPLGIQQYSLKAKAEWPKEPKTYARYYVQIARYASVADATSQGSCRVLPSAHAAVSDKSMYAMCEGFVTGRFVVEVMTDALLFTYGTEQGRLVAALRDAVSAKEIH